MRRTPTPLALWCWGFLALAVSAAAWIAIAAWGEGRLVAPLDDAYIALGYARNLAHGLPFRFQPGDPPSTGSTSLLYTVALVPVAAFAGRHDAVIAAGLLGLNAVLLWLTLIVTWRIAAQLVDGWLAHAATLAVALSGYVVWGFCCGLDTGLATLAGLWLWEKWSASADDRSNRWWVLPAVASGVAAFTRPEAVFWVAAAGGAAIAGSSGNRKRMKLLAGAGILLACVLVTAGLPAILTGSPMASSGWAKTTWASPVASKMGAASASARYLVDSLKGLWMGAYPSEAEVGLVGGGAAGNEVIWAFPPGALAAFLVGVLALPVASRETASIGGAIWAAGWISVAAILPVGWHHHRYLIPLFPPFILISFCGISRLAQAFPESWRRTAVRGIAAAWLAFEIPGFGEAFRFVGHGTEGYAAHHRAMADVLSALPEPGAVGATDVGILGYFTDRRMIDLKGLTSPALHPACAYGWGSVYDVMKVRAAAERPRFVALHPGRIDTNAEQLLRAGILRERVSLPHPRIDSRFVLYEADWGEAGPGPSLRGWRIVDEVDAGDPAAESAHRWRIGARGPEGEPYNSLQVRLDSSLNRVVGDGGWVTNGRESFRVRAAAGKALLLFLRTFAPRDSAVDVALNGGHLGRVHIAPNQDRFQTILLAQQDGSLVREFNEVEVACAWPLASEFSAYHYWVLQPVGAEDRGAEDRP